MSPLAGSMQWLPNKSAPTVHSQNSQRDPVLLGHAGPLLRTLQWLCIAPGLTEQCDLFPTFISSVTHTHPCTLLSSHTVLLVNLPTPLAWSVVLPRSHYIAVLISFRALLRCYLLCESCSDHWRKPYNLHLHPRAPRLADNLLICFVFCLLSLSCPLACKFQKGRSLCVLS